jgi:nucleotide-binding universal stress UspA family protein
MSRPSRYLVAIDFSANARRALTTARELARQSGAMLTLAHVRPFSDVRAAVVEERGDLLKGGAVPLAREMAKHYARRLDDWANSSSGDKTLLLRGAPDVALARAGRGYDLIFVGSHGRGSVPELLIGSTVQRVLARSSVPVVVVPKA